MNNILITYCKDCIYRTYTETGHHLICCNDESNSYGWERNPNWYCADGKMGKEKFTVPLTNDFFPLRK